VRDPFGLELAPPRQRHLGAQRDLSEDASSAPPGGVGPIEREDLRPAADLREKRGLADADVLEEAHAADPEDRSLESGRRPLRLGHAGGAFLSQNRSSTRAGSASQASA
jgi:hypothetical protein